MADLTKREAKLADQSLERRALILEVAEIVSVIDATQEYMGMTLSSPERNALFTTLLQRGTFKREAGT